MKCMKEWNDWTNEWIIWNDRKWHERYYDWMKWMKDSMNERMHNMKWHEMTWNDMNWHEVQTDRHSDIQTYRHTDIPMCTLRIMFVCNDVCMYVRTYVRRSRVTYCSAAEYIYIYIYLNIYIYIYMYVFFAWRKEDCGRRAIFVVALPLVISRCDLLWFIDAPCRAWSFRRHSLIAFKDTLVIIRGRV